jgi:hypothetical protein
MAAGTALKIINKRVKHLARLHPGAKRITLQKQAGREYKAGKLGRVRHKTVVHKKKKVHHKSVGATRHEVGKDRTDSKRVNITVGNITRSQHMNAIRKGYQETIAAWLVKEMNADTVRKKTKIRRYVNKLKAQLRKLESI